MIIALDNIRSLYNVGSILRTCAFYGIQKIILIGYTGIVKEGESMFIHPKIKKTGMSGIEALEFKFFDTRQDFIKYCHDNGIEIVCLEQDKRSINLENFRPVLHKQVYVLGNEVLGISQDLLNSAKEIVEIKTHKSFYHSLNVTVASGIFINHLIQYK